MGSVTSKNEVSAFRQFLIIFPGPYFIVMQLLENVIFMEFPGNLFSLTIQNSF